MFSIRKCLFATGFALLISAAPMTASVLAVPAAASEIKYVVNDIPITSYDIQRRAAFLKLQNRKGNLTAAAGDELVEQALRTAEMKRLGIKITDQAVSDAYVRFATSNKMTENQLDGVMSQTGVTKAHFKEFIRTQMGWSQVHGGAPSLAKRQWLERAGRGPAHAQAGRQQADGDRIHASAGYLRRAGR